MKKMYEHIGILPLEIAQPNGTLRVETGERFEADLPVDLEQFFFRAGLAREVPSDAAPVTATATTYDFPKKKRPAAGTEPEDGAKE